MRHSPDPRPETDFPGLRAGAAGTTPWGLPSTARPSHLPRKWNKGQFGSLLHWPRFECPLATHGWRAGWTAPAHTAPSHRSPALEVRGSHGPHEGDSHTPEGPLHASVLGGGPVSRLQTQGTPSQGLAGTPALLSPAPSRGPRFGSAQGLHETSQSAR